MFLKSLHLQNLLSFGPDAQPISLGRLNVLIGPNGSGKSNLIEAIGLLAAAPTSLGGAIREGGGVTEWLWKGSKGPVNARIKAAVGFAKILTHELVLSQSGQYLLIVDERIAEDAPNSPSDYFGRNDSGVPVLRMQGGAMEALMVRFNPNESILSQRRDPIAYPELSSLERAYSNIVLYRDWQFGRSAPPRLPQPADLPNAFLSEDARNLGLVLNQIRKDPEAKEALLKHLGLIYEGVRDVDVSVVGGTVQVFLHEHKWIIPATRLSDGTLRWLSLLAILLNPREETTIVCIEEPEMGLHPDLLPPLAQLLREASQRMQLIVTTHSDVLIDALTDTPESVIVCEKHEGSTMMRRLNKDELSSWLEKYSLGQLWRSGEIGGNRW
jgi:predicted ATPase